MCHRVHTYCPPSLSQLLLYDRLFGKLYLTIAGFSVFYVQIWSPSFQWTFYCWGCFNCKLYGGITSPFGTRFTGHISWFCCYQYPYLFFHHQIVFSHAFPNMLQGMCTGLPYLRILLVLAIFPFTQVSATLGPIQNVGFHSGCCYVLIWHRDTISFSFLMIVLHVYLCLCLKGKIKIVGIQVSSTLLIM